MLIKLISPYMMHRIDDFVEIVFRVEPKAKSKALGRLNGIFYAKSRQAARNKEDDDKYSSKK